MKATAAVLRESSEAFVLEPVNLAPLRRDEVLVALTATGVCHTDLTCRAGFAAAPRPVVLGHEGAGTVVDIGSEVTALSPGDSVILTFWSCGRCARCVAGDSIYCLYFSAGNMSGRRPDSSSPLSSGRDSVGGHFFGQSSFGTHCITTDRNAIRVPKGTPLDVLAPLGCSGLTGAGTVISLLQPDVDDRLLVIGAGGVGLAAVMAGAALGLREIIVVEPRAARREIATSVGATTVLAPEQFEALQAEAFDCAIDTSGVPAVVERLGELVAPRGQVAFLTAMDSQARLSLRLLSSMRTGATFRGVRMGGGHPKDVIPRLVELHQAGKFPIERLITAFPFEQIEAAMAAVHDGTAIKPVLIFNPTAAVGGVRT